VQKCFGLPAGLGLLILSPRAIKHAQNVGEKKHYNSLSFMVTMMEKWQTPYTPNVLGIYLLMRVLEKSEHIATIDKKLEARYTDWLRFLSKRKTISHLVKNESVHSHTVIPVTGNSETVASIKKLAKKQGILLGEGYGEFKPVTFRIANFPALKQAEINKLKRFLSAF
jgi:phosphoserine aminotransferase